MNQLELKTHIMYIYVPTNAPYYVYIYIQYKYIYIYIWLVNVQDPCYDLPRPSNLGVTDTLTYLLETSCAVTKEATPPAVFSVKDGKLLGRWSDDSFSPAEMCKTEKLPCDNGPGD